MSALQPVYPYIADHALITSALFALLQEAQKDVVVEAVGRVFYGFKVTHSSNTVVVSGEALAINAAGELLIRAAADGDFNASPSLSASKHYPVYAYIQEQAVTPTVNRKQWDTGTVAEDTVSVSVQKKKIVQTVVAAARSIATIDLSTYFPSTITDGGGVVRTVLPLGVLVTDGSANIASIVDCRRMYAVNGNVNGAVTGLANELPHDFTGFSDSADLGIPGTRSFLKALASQTQKVLGRSTNFGWSDAPPASLEAIGDAFDGNYTKSGLAVTYSSGTTFNYSTGVAFAHAYLWSITGSSITVAGSSELYGIYVNSSGAVASIALTSGGGATFIGANVDTFLANSALAVVQGSSAYDVRRFRAGLTRRLVVTPSGSYADCTDIQAACTRAFLTSKGTAFPSVEVAVAGALSVSAPINVSGSVSIVGAFKGAKITWTGSHCFEVGGADVEVRNILFDSTDASTSTTQIAVAAASGSDRLRVVDCRLTSSAGGHRCQLVRCAGTTDDVEIVNNTGTDAYIFIELQSGQYNRCRILGNRASIGSGYSASASDNYGIKYTGYTTDLEIGGNSLTGFDYSIFVDGTNTAYLAVSIHHNTVTMSGAGQCGIWVQRNFTSVGQDSVVISGNSVSWDSAVGSTQNGVIQVSYTSSGVYAVTVLSGNTVAVTGTGSPLAPVSPIYVDDPHATLSGNNTYYNNSSGAGQGIVCNKPGICVSGGQVAVNGAGGTTYGIALKARGCSITGVQFYQCGALINGGTHCSITGCHFDLAGDSGANTLIAEDNYFNIVGNTFYEGGAASTGRIALNNGLVGGVVIGNNTDGTGAIIATTTATYITTGNSHA